jgi:hypothetical protein
VLGNLSGIHRTTHNLAVALSRSGQQEEAKQLYRKSALLLEDLGSPLLAAVSRFQMANQELRIGNFGAAAENYEQLVDDYPGDRQPWRSAFSAG